MFKLHFMLCICYALFFVIRSQIAYEEEVDLDKGKQNLNGRKPVYLPARCPRYQLLYPGDQLNDWICDCSPAALYYPETDACYPAYKRGPCKEGEMLVLYKEKVVPECVSNPCQTDGLFRIRDKCFEFGNSNHSSNPCPNKELTFVLGVNPRTLMVDCVQLSMQVETRFSLGETAPNDYYIDMAEKCMRGSRLVAQGHCSKQP
ncbi:uncharacterized protein LOC6567586 [Drosophila grimshawi]|uniref:GH17899 n=1 Tax=Drosophila grimshawi TaxID=7222 RepID=B4JSL1_DROGR|nr:uncharacterized protein LOC6567586 [Drosophila grimshawi]EDV94751.1 GH17899 [Drosophila grimshawi]